MPSVRPGRATACVLLFALAAPAADPPPAAVAVRVGRLVDGSGGPPIDDAVLVVRGGVIEAAGPAATTPVPDGARVVDHRSRTVMPGLVSAHVHVGQVDGVTNGAANFTRANVLRQLRQYEAYGVTTVCSLGLNGPLVYELRGPLHAGELPGADLFSGDRGLGPPGGAPRETSLKFGPHQIDRPATPDDARKMVRAAKARGADVIKMWVDDLSGTLPAKLTPAVVGAAIAEAHAVGLKAAAHVYTLDDARALVAAGVDVLAHGVRDRPVDAEFVRAMRDRGVWYVPTIVVDDLTTAFADPAAWTADDFVRRAMHPALKAQVDAPEWRARGRSGPAADAARAAVAVNLRNVKALHDGGVRVALGTDSGAFPVRVPGVSEHRELRLLADAGLSPADVVVAATRHAAGALGLTDRGVLARGKRADILVLDGDPTRDVAATTRIVEVWQRGKRASGPVAEFTP